MDSFISLSNHLLSPRCLHCCPQRNDFSPSGVSAQQSPDLRSRPSRVVPFVYGEVVLSPHCTNLCSPGCIELHKLHYSVYAWVFCSASATQPITNLKRMNINEDLNSELS